MPELPEVETVKRILEPLLIGRKILSVELFREKNIFTDPKEFASSLPGKKIVSLTRKGKYLLFHLEDAFVLLAHLRMEGKFFLKEENAPYGKFDLIALHLDNGKKLIYQDVRKFGGMGLYREKDLLKESALSHLGKEPFEWDEKEFARAMKGKKGPIKEVIMDQSFVAGIGNIYADESLFASRIHPRTPADSLSEEEATSLLFNARRIMQEAIDLGGSTIHSFHPFEGVNGAMQNKLLAYGNKDNPCPRCGYPLKKTTVGGRGTTYCPICQRNKAMPFVLLLTGPIHSGKSLARAFFQGQGYQALDADQIVKLLYQKKEIIQKAKQVLGKNALSRNKINGKAVLGIFLKSPKKKKEWEQYIHPLVKKEIEKALKQIGPNQKVCLECQLPFESKIDLLADMIVLVTADPKNRKARLLEEGRDADQLLSLNQDYPLSLAKRKADFILENDGTIEDFTKKLGNYPNEMLSLFGSGANTEFDEIVDLIPLPEDFE